MRPANPALDVAMASALAQAGAAGEAERKSREATADWFDPPRRRLYRLWFVYTASTREFPHRTPFHRARMRSAVAAYRQLAGRDRRRPAIRERLARAA